MIKKQIELSVQVLSERMQGSSLQRAVLSIEMGADAHDIGLSIHPHPTLSESVAMASEIKEGSITDLYIKKNNLLYVGH